MTKQEILDALEGLKDLTNHVGRQTIDSVKGEILRNLLERYDLPVQTVDAHPEPAPAEAAPPILEDVPYEGEKPWKPLNEPETKVVPRNYKSKKVTKFKKKR